MSVASWISTFGFLAAILVVDRISKRILIPASLLGICICGLFLSTFPSYPIFLLIYCLLAIFADMLYWPTMLLNRQLNNRKVGLCGAGKSGKILK